MEIQIELIYWCFSFYLLNRQPWHGGRDWKSLYLVKLLVQMLPICEVSFDVSLNHGRFGGHVLLYFWPAQLHLTSSSLEMKFWRWRIRFAKEMRLKGLRWCRRK